MRMHHEDIVNIIKESGYSCTLTIGPPQGKQRQVSHCADPQLFECKSWAVNLTKLQTELSQFLGLSQT